MAKLLLAQPIIIYLSHFPSMPEKLNYFFMYFKKPPSCLLSYRYC